MKERKHKVLIIKTGYSEILDNLDTKIPSYGDILRTTPLLHIYKNDFVTWVTDEKAIPLLEGNPYIDSLLTLNSETIMDLLDTDFDTVINLEKNHRICKLSNKIDAWRKYGFRFDKKNNCPEAYDRAYEVLAVSADSKLKKENQRTFFELLFEMVGEKWNGEECILGYKPKSNKVYDIGLNTQVGKKWPSKKWSNESWDKLEEKLIKDGLRVTRQDKQSSEVLKNLNLYIDWINSCKTIVSNDSLGLHLGITLKKNVLGLFGSSPNKEVYFYERGKSILPEPKPDCSPCFKENCEKERSCMEDISAERVYREIKNLYKSK